MTGIRDGALHERAGDRVGAVEDDHLDTRLGGGFEEVSQGSFVGVKAGADILHVEHDGVESFQNIGGWPASGVGVAVNAIDRNAGGRVLRVGDVGGVHRAGDAVLGTEDGIERDARGLGEDVDGAASLRVQAGLVGEQSDFLFAIGGADGIEVVGLEHIDSGLHRSVAGGDAAGRGLGLVVSGDAFPAQFIFFADGERKGRGHGGRDLGAQRHHASLPAGMYGAGQQDDVGAGGGIDPDRCAGESGVAERSHGEKVAAIAGKRRIDVPAEASQFLGGGRLLRRGHLLDHVPRQNRAALQQGEGKL